jgi:hypothetical protein
MQQKWKNTNSTQTDGYIIAAEHHDETILPSQDGMDDYIDYWRNATE